MPLHENFARWYDDDGFTFHAETRISYTQCGPDGNLSLFDFLRLTADIASEDVARRGTSMPFLVDQGIARVLARSSYHIFRMPKIDENIELVTTEEKPDSLQFTRDYKFKDSSGNLLAVGESKWLLTDFKTRKIKPTSIVEKFRKLNTATLEKQNIPCGKISVPAEMEKAGEQWIRHSHIDGNCHTDNAFYGAFAFDAFPEEFVGRPIVDFRINYSKEMLLGEKIELFTAKISESKLVVVGKKAEEVSFACEFRF